jgi:hypothetical protein
MMRTIVSAFIAVALVGAASVTTASAAGGVGGGFGGGGSYPASFGGNYAEGAGDCHLVAQRVMTRYGWRTRRVQVCN